MDLLNPSGWPPCCHWAYSARQQEYHHPWTKHNKNDSAWIYWKTWQTVPEWGCMCLCLCVCLCVWMHVCMYWSQFMDICLHSCWKLNLQHGQSGLCLIIVWWGPVSARAHTRTHTHTHTHTTIGIKVPKKIMAVSWDCEGSEAWFRPSTRPRRSPSRHRDAEWLFVKVPTFRRSCTSRYSTMYTRRTYSTEMCF